MGRRKLDAKIDEKILGEVMKQTVKVGTGLVSTKDLAKKLGISEPVIFGHFKTKPELMNATFVYAWDRVFKNDPVVAVAHEHGADLKFEYYRDAIVETLRRKKEICYLHHYLASSFFDNDLVMSKMQDSLSEFNKVFHSFDPKAGEQKMTFLGRTAIEVRINICYDFAMGYYPINDEYLRDGFFIVNSGFKRALEESLKNPCDSKNDPR
jgi:AcrR family transcriptional regulator